jgi:hypothetical protein
MKTSPRLIPPAATKAVALQIRSSKLEARNNTKCSRSKFARHDVARPERRRETFSRLGHFSLSLIRACFGSRHSHFRLFSAFTSFARASLYGVLLGFGQLLVQPCAGAPFVFDNTGGLATARSLHTATLLSNGKVLVAGGRGGSGYLVSAELYDPASGIWTATGSLANARGHHTATLLPNGKVLVA